MEKQNTYKVNTSTNFSIGEKEYYLKKGDQVELPQHELIESMRIHKHIERIEKPIEPQNEINTNHEN